MLIIEQLACIYWATDIINYSANSVKTAIAKDLYSVMFRILATVILSELHTMT